ncbi:hypothetical protein I308_106003 [Cryptococcus tetragattii IND107]|uniref:Uncharacterized protein n=1 Tax=Cryptococcus tetragattii IND107 TaxID=1296105 RepID=A0ABR3BKS1_9TREE
MSRTLLGRLRVTGGHGLKMHEQIDLQKTTVLSGRQQKILQLSIPYPDVPSFGHAAPPLPYSPPSHSALQAISDN